MLVNIRFCVIFTMFVAMESIPARKACAADVIQDVLANWLDRAAKYRSFQLGWIQHESFTTGSVMNESVPRSKNPSGKLFPEKTTTYDTDHKLSVDNNKFRYTRRGSLLLTLDREMARQNKISVFDGEINKTLLDPAGSVKHHQGYIGNEKIIPSVQDQALLPLWLFFRPFNPHIQIFLFDQESFSKQLVVSPQLASINNIECVTDSSVRKATLFF